MTVEDKIVEKLEWQNKLLKAQLVILTEIKFELQNSRKISEATYTIPLPKKKDLFKRYVRK